MAMPIGFGVGESPAPPKGPAEAPKWNISKPKDHETMPPEFRWETPPVPVSIAPPVYPFDELLSGAVGDARIRFVTGLDGRVIDAELVSATSPPFGAAALAAVETWTFKPAKSADGAPCMALLGERFQFQPSGTPSVAVSSTALYVLGLQRTESNGIVELSEADAMAKRIATTRPVFPRALRTSAKDGLAVIEYFIDPDGGVQLPRIVGASAPEFGSAAAHAVASWRLTPEKGKNKRVFTRTQTTVLFDLSDGAASAAPASTK
jgi:TonB family protein